MKITGTVKKTSCGPGEDPNIHDAIVTLTVGSRELASLQTDRSGHFSYEEESYYGGATLMCRVENPGFLPYEHTRTIDADELHLDIHLESQIPEKKTHSSTPSDNWKYWLWALYVLVPWMIVAAMSGSDFTMYNLMIVPLVFVILAGWKPIEPVRGRNVVLILASASWIVLMFHEGKGKGGLILLMLGIGSILTFISAWVVAWICKWLGGGTTKPEASG